MTSRIGIFLGAVAFLAIPAHSLAHKGAMGDVKVRMDNMSAISKSTKAIGLMLAGKSDVDLGVIAEQAELISNHAAQIPANFEKKVSSEVSEASPKIWDDLATFNRIAADLEKNALLLATNAQDGSDVAKLAPIFKQIGKSCASCHKSFRVKK